MISSIFNHKARHLPSHVQAVKLKDGRAFRALVRCRALRSRGASTFPLEKNMRLSKTKNVHWRAEADRLARAAAQIVKLTYAHRWMPGTDDDPAVQRIQRAWRKTIGALSQSDIAELEQRFGLLRLEAVSLAAQDV
jgi:hypothetical protein